METPQFLWGACTSVQLHSHWEPSCWYVIAISCVEISVLPFYLQLCGPLRDWLHAPFPWGQEKTSLISMISKASPSLLSFLQAVVGREGCDCLSRRYPVLNLLLHKVISGRPSWIFFSPAALLYALNLLASGSTYWKAETFGDGRSFFPSGKRRPLLGYPEP